MKTIIGVAICIVAALIGVTIGLAMGGFGICAVSVSASMVLSSIFAGAVLSGIISVIWPRIWWVGACAFCAPVLIGIPLALTSGERDRLLGLCATIAGSSLAAFVVRYPSPRSLKR